MTNENFYDLIVIGAGPGGYVAAIKASQLGKKVALIEKNQIGGTCLNVGCIPTKTFVANAHILHQLKKASQYGIKIDDKNISIDFLEMKKRKDAVVLNLRNSLTNLIKSNGITIFSGSASFIDKKKIKVSGETNIELEAKNFIIAAGSEPMDIKSFPCDGKKIHNSTTMLDIEKLPKKLVIIGGGYIGCEFASIYAQMNVDVTIVEALPSILATHCKSVSTPLTEILKKQNIKILTNAKVEKINDRENGIEVQLKEMDPIEADIALVSVGRCFANCSDLNLAKAGVATNEKSQILVDDYMKTNIDGIYAIGDIVGKFMLAHVASHQGIIAVLNIFKKANKTMNYNAIPSAIFTIPEIGICGITQEEAVEKKIDINVSKYPFSALGKSMAALEIDGYVEIISDKKYGQVLGGIVVGDGASVLIAEINLAIANELTLDCIIDTIHAHPTTPEAILEACEIATGFPMHFPPIKKNI
jgi:dihydrolipoamide dehydrogenase